MAKIEYKVCDICGNNSREQRYCFIDGAKRIYLSLFNSMDICRECINKIKIINSDIENEASMSHWAFEDMPSEYKKEGNEDLFHAYSLGVETAINKSLKNKIKKLKIKGNDAQKR